MHGETPLEPAITLGIVTKKDFDVQCFHLLKCIQYSSHSWCVQFIRKEMLVYYKCHMSK